MPGKPVEFHPEALEEAQAAMRWYRERSEPAAVGFMRELERAVAEAPQRWPAGAAGTRRFLLRRYPFCLVYRERPSSVQIIAAAHGRRRPGYWRHRSIRSPRRRRRPAPRPVPGGLGDCRRAECGGGYRPLPHPRGGAESPPTQRVPGLRVCPTWKVSVVIPGLKKVDTAPPLTL